ncbi:hypothetical protein TCAL_12012, partial [Tigriopus californicus]|eukprot:TCALIF_12012-PA protein Name:"Protein of unknown function" AED:0.01 eAED:0.01 QI:12/1/0.66/1/0/0.33/3/0/502
MSKLTREYKMHSGKRLAFVQTVLLVILLSLIVHFTLSQLRESQSNYVPYIFRIKEKYVDLEPSQGSISVEYEAEATAETSTHPMLNLNPTLDDWIGGKIKGYRIFAFSAFLDIRNASAPYIRVLGAAPTNYEPFVSDILCDVFQEDGQPLKTVPSEIRIQMPSNGASNCSFFFECDLSSISRSVWQTAYWVSLKSSRPPDQNNTSLPKLRVHHLALPNPADSDGTFVACIKPFFGLWNSPFALVEFIEMYKILGVSHFVFYDTSIGTDARRVLNYYAAKGLVTLFRWTLPYDRRDILHNAHHTCINDCKMRVINRFEFLVTVDVDEFLLPTNGMTTLYALIQEIHKKEQANNRNPSLIGAYTFLNKFFFKEFGKVTKDDGEGGKTEEKLRNSLSTQAYVQRSPSFFEYRRRSKYIARPNATDFLTVHHTANFSQGYRDYVVPSHLGLSQHYRLCAWRGIKICLMQKPLIDTNAWTWASLLVPAVKEACLLLDLNNINVCPFI